MKYNSTRISFILFVCFQVVFSAGQFQLYSPFISHSPITKAFPGWYAPTQTSIIIFVGLIFSFSLRDVFIKLSKSHLNIYNEFIALALLAVLSAKIATATYLAIQWIPLTNVENTGDLWQTFFNYYSTVFNLFVVRDNSYTFHWIIWAALYYSGFVYIRNQQQKIKALGLESLIKESELITLNNDFNPKTVTNKLDSIHSLIESDPENAKREIIILSKSIRHTIYPE